MLINDVDLKQMNAIEKATSLQKKIEVCQDSFEDLNVKVQSISVAPIECEYITLNYLLFRTGRQNKQLVNIVISICDTNNGILQVEESLQFELKKRSLPYVGKIHARLQYPLDKIAKIGVYLQEI